MSETFSWPWTALFLLGAYHGINPGMGWLFAVALGLQEKSSRAVWRALGPISLGHALAIGAMVLLAALAQAVLPLRSLKIGMAVILFAVGLYRFVHHRHPRWGGMQVGFRDLTMWSFIMASSHGAGLMVLPILLVISKPGTAESLAGHMHHQHMGSAAGVIPNLAAVLVHTAGYLLVTGLLAWVVYEKLGLALLRKAWLNLDMIWVVALMVTGAFVLVF